jgi:hypothetical protein
VGVCRGSAMKILFVKKILFVFETNTMFPSAVVGSIGGSGVVGPQGVHRRYTVVSQYDSQRCLIYSGYSDYGYLGYSGYSGIVRVNTVVGIATRVSHRHLTLIDPS